MVFHLVFCKSEQLTCIFVLHEKSSHGRFADTITLLSPPFRGVRRWPVRFVWREMLQRRGYGSCLQQKIKSYTVKIYIHC